MAVPKRINPQIQPDPQQFEAIKHVSGPMLVLAGAGTGKTTVLIRRIANLVREGHARPDEILALTYTNNAAAEMIERVQKELRGVETAGLQVSTFHAYCNELLIRAGRNFRVLDDQQLWIFLRRNIRELRLNHYVRAASITEFLKDLLDFMRRCLDEMVGPEQYRAYVQKLERGELPLPRVGKSKYAAQITQDEALGRCREIAFVFETVERMLHERNFGTFGHMILRTFELLSKDPVLLERERSHAKFMLVDEFQDANFAQIKVLERLAGVTSRAPTAAHDNEPRARNVFAVGDPDQGIYRFRGASSEAFEHFQHLFPESKLLVLSKNRRSTTPVLRCAYSVISRNPEFALQAGEDGFRRLPLISARDEEDPKQAALRRKVEGVLVNGKLIEATDVVSALIELQRRARCEWKDIGILYRSHFHRDEIAAELTQRAIPFSIEGLDVLDASDVRDLLACLAAVVFLGNGAAVFRVTALPQFGVDPAELKTVMKSLRRNESRGMVAALEKVRGGAEILSAIEHARQAIAGKKIHEALMGLTTQFKIKRSSVVHALLQFAAGWQASPIVETGSASEFLEYLEMFREAGGCVPLAANEGSNSVRLMTAHSAKGLEFDHVFILRAVSNSFPASYRESLIEVPDALCNFRQPSTCDEKEMHKQEERRLFYVAMTRARDTLTIYGQFGRGEKDKTPPGFMRELIKDRELNNYFAHRTCRAFQTDIFAAAEAAPLTRLAQWVELPAGPDLAATLSASAIQRYEICPLQFKLERDWRLPAEASAALQYGAAIHRVLLAYFQSLQQNHPFEEPALIDLFRAELANAGFSDAYQLELYEQKGIAELRELIANARSAPPDVLHTEEQFSIKVGPTNLVGRIDRMDRAPDGGVIITDYKTGRPKSQEDADESLQLSLYALAAREKWGYRVDRLVFHNLDGNSAVATARTDRDLQNTKLKVEEIALKIAEGRFAPKAGMHCIFCAYRSLCPKTEKKIPELLAIAAAETN
jgi:ATP-dependent DNA helicase UvrD/PcrA